MGESVCLKNLYEARGEYNYCECPICSGNELAVIEVFVKENCERCHALLSELRKGNSRLYNMVYDVESADGLARMAWRELVKIGQDKGLPVVWIRVLGQAVAGEEALEAFGINRPHPDPLPEGASPEGEGEKKGHVQRAPTEGEGENVGAIQESPANTKPTGGCTDDSCALPG